jgi:transposase
MREVKTYCVLKFVVKNYRTLGKHGIAKKLKCSPLTVYSWVNDMRKLGLDIPNSRRGSHITIKDFVKKYMMETAKVK